MHPTDTLIALSQARIARAAAQGHRKAEQPTRLSDRQHLARLAQSDPWAVKHSITKATGSDVLIFRASGAVERLKALRIADADLSGASDAAL